MATFEEQCALVSESFIASRDRNTSNPAIVAIFDRLDMAGPLAAAVIAGDISLESSRPAEWIAEAYISLSKLKPTEASTQKDQVSESSGSNPFFVSAKKMFSNSGDLAEPAESTESERSIEIYDIQYNQAQIDEMEAIVATYKSGNKDEALHRARIHLENLKNAENVELYSAYNIAYFLHEDEFRSNDVEAFCRDMFEFVSSFTHSVGASATNSFVYSFLLPERKFEEAQDLLQRAISWNVGFESLNALSNFGQILFRKKDFFRAEAIFTFVRQSDVGHMRPEANYWLGRIYHETNRATQAELIWKEVAQVSRDSYRSMAEDCLNGNVPQIQSIEGTQEIKFVPELIATSRNIPSSIPSVENSKVLLKASFPGIDFDMPARTRRITTTEDEIGDVAGFFDCLIGRNFFESTSNQNYWSELIDYYQFYDAIDEHVVRFVAELAKRSINLGSWQDLSAYSRTHFVLGNLELCLAAWRVHFAKEEIANSLSDMSIYPVISLYAHLTRCDNGELARQLAKISEIESGEIIKFLESYIIEREDSLGKALDVVLSLSTDGFAITELTRCLVQTRDHDWKEIRQQLWELDSKRLESGDESNNGLQGEMLRLNCLMGRCAHEFAPEHDWVSGIDLFSAALVDAYYLRWDKFCFNLADAMRLSSDHFEFGSTLFNKVATELPLRSMAADAKLPTVIFELMCEMSSVELMVKMSQNEAAKDVVQAKNPGTYSIITGTAPIEDLKLALKTNIAELAEIVAQYENLDADLISILAEYDNDQVLKRLLQNKNCSADLALTLITRISNDSCWELAGASDTDPEVLAYLAQHEAESVRRAVAKNPNTPDKCFDMLAGDTAWTVRDAVKNNKNAPDSARAIALLME